MLLFTLRVCRPRLPSCRLGPFFSHQWRVLSSSSSSPADTKGSVESSTSPTPKQQRRRLDPLAKRPNQKCDPYGQGGKPLELTQAQSLHATVDDAWQLEYSGNSISNATTLDSDLPLALVREFYVTDFIQAARLASVVAAAAQLQNHFPAITIDRRIARKGEWQTLVKVRCNTLVLGGLSTHDFHLAMVSDANQYVLDALDGLTNDGNSLHYKQSNALATTCKFLKLCLFLLL